MSIVSLAPHFMDRAKAGLHLHGSGGSSQALGRSVINAGASPLAFLNRVKGLELNSPQSNFTSLLSADGYPTGTISSSISLQASNTFDPTYYGRYYIWWTGTGSFQMGWPTIVYSGGAAVNGVNPSSSGSVAFNFATGLVGQPTQAAPVEFAFGVLITAVGTNAGLVQLTAGTNMFSQLN